MNLPQAFETRTDKSTSVVAVPGIEGRICHISKEMKEHLQQLRMARKEGLNIFPPLRKDSENSDSD